MKSPILPILILTLLLTARACAAAQIPDALIRQYFGAQNRGLGWFP